MKKLSSDFLQDESKSSHFRCNFKIISLSYYKKPTWKTVKDLILQ